LHNRSFVIGALLLAGCASKTADTADAAGNDLRLGSYSLQFSLIANTCGDAIPATSTTTWEFREVAGELVLLSDIGSQLQSSDGGKTFSSAVPVSANGCEGTNEYRVELMADGDEVVGSSTSTLTLTTTCDEVPASCSYAFDVVGQRS
jgi:hypothetical protein